jgi:hypothetical protein
MVAPGRRRGIGAFPGAAARSTPRPAVGPVLDGVVGRRYHVGVTPTTWLGIAGCLIAGLGLLTAVARRGTHGTFLGLPYDWRRPTWDVVRERVWNPDDPRILTPKVLGWGWTINLGRLWRLTRRFLAGRATL